MILKNPNSAKSFSNLQDLMSELGIIDAITLEFSIRSEYFDRLLELLKEVPAQSLAHLRNQFISIDDQLKH